MKNLISLFIVSVALIGCGKDSGGGGSTAKSPNNDLKNANTAVCSNAQYQNGRWYDYNGIELPQCKKIQNYMNSKYLLTYDNNYCMSRVYKKEPTYHVILNGVNKCAAEKYFLEFGHQNIHPQLGRTHYIGQANSQYGHNGRRHHHSDSNQYEYEWDASWRSGGSWSHGGYWRTGGRHEAGYDLNNGYYCSGCGCRIGDGKWDACDVSAIALGAGLIFAIGSTY